MRALITMIKLTVISFNYLAHKFRGAREATTHLLSRVDCTSWRRKKHVCIASHFSPDQRSYSTISVKHRHRMKRDNICQYHSSLI